MLCVCVKGKESVMSTPEPAVISIPSPPSQHGQYELHLPSTTTHLNTYNTQVFFIYSQPPAGYTDRPSILLAFVKQALVTKRLFHYIYNDS